MTGAIPIFDIDTHYNEPPDLWTSRAPNKFKDQVLHVQENEHGRDSWFLSGREVAMTGPCVVDTELEKHFADFSLPKYDQMALAGTHASDRLALMDSIGIGTQLVYPNVIGFGGQVLMGVTNDPELRLFHVEAYNNAILDFQKDSGGRILPQAALPLWDMDATLKELERIRKMGLSGIAMSHSPGDFGQQPLSAPVWDRFFATCQDLGLPINFHVGSGNWSGDMAKWWGEDPNLWTKGGKLNGPMATYATVQVHMANGSDICNLVLTGILEKFPKLKFVSVESGCGWVPFTIQCMEYHWDELMDTEYSSKFKRRPKEMFQDQIYCSYWFENNNSIEAFVKELGPDNLMFETDFPHPSSLYPTSVIHEKVDALRNLDQETREKILYKNAERVYGVEVYRPKMSSAELANA